MKSIIQKYYFFSLISILISCSDDAGNPVTNDSILEKSKKPEVLYIGAMCLNPNNLKEIIFTGGGEFESDVSTITTYINFGDGSSRSYSQETTKNTEEWISEGKCLCSSFSIGGRTTCTPIMLLKHTYSTNGQFQIQLRFTDENGSSEMAEGTLTVPIPADNEGNRSVVLFGD